MSLDRHTHGIAFSTLQEFELLATVQEENGIRINVPGWLITKIKQRVGVMYLDLLTSIFLRTVLTLPSTEDDELDMDLILPSAVELG